MRSKPLMWCRTALWCQHADAVALWWKVNGDLVCLWRHTWMCVHMCTCTAACACVHVDVHTRACEYVCVRICLFPQRVFWSKLKQAKNLQSTSLRAPAHTACAVWYGDRRTLTGRTLTRTPTTPSKEPLALIAASQRRVAAWPNSCRVTNRIMTIARRTARTCGATRTTAAFASGACGTSTTTAECSGGALRDRDFRETCATSSPFWCWRFWEF